MLDKELKLGPAKLNLADINWPSGIQDTIDVLNNALLGLVIMYSLAAGLSALSAVAGVLCFLKPETRLVDLVNLAIGGLGFLCALIGSIIVTAATNTGVKGVNKIGEKVGLVASRGDKFYALTWVATAFMGVVVLFWLVRFCAGKRRRNKLEANKEGISH
jgi:hypothetical protein